MFGLNNKKWLFAFWITITNKIFLDTFYQPIHMDSTCKRKTPHTCVNYHQICSHLDIFRVQSFDHNRIHLTSSYVIAPVGWDIEGLGLHLGCQFINSLQMFLTVLLVLIWHISHPEQLFYPSKVAEYVI